MPNCQVIYIRDAREFKEFNDDTMLLRKLLGGLQSRYGHEIMARMAATELLVLLLGEQVEPSEQIEAYFANLAQTFKTGGGNGRRA